MKINTRQLQFDMAEMNNANNQIREKALLDARENAQTDFDWGMNRAITFLNNGEHSKEEAENRINYIEQLMTEAERVRHFYFISGYRRILEQN